MKTLLRSGSSLAQLLRFLAIGVVNTLFGYGVYALLVWIGLAPQLALSLAFAIGVLWNYLTHARLVFRVSGFRRVLPYAGVYGALYTVNALALWAALAAGLSPYIAQAILAVAMAGLSFFLVSAVLTGRLPFVRRG